MSLKTFVKIGRIDNLSDARYCAGMMADILGFNLEEGSTGYIDPQTFKEISDWVAGVKFAGEFKDAAVAEIKLATTNYPIDFIEVQNVDVLEELSDLSQGLILKVVIANASDLEKLSTKLSYAKEFVAFTIIDCQEADLYEEIEQVLSKGDANNIIRSYGVNESTAPDIATNSQFVGIELEGSPEERPGFKDYGLVMDILEVLEED